MKSCCSNDEKHGPEFHSHSSFAVAAHCTFRCLLGCGLGEIVGFIIATSLGWPNVEKIIFSIFLSFVFGFILAIWPLLKTGFNLSKAFKIVFVTEFISISVMVAAEVLVEISIPGVMQATLADPIFWIGLSGALAAGYIVALPFNYLMVRAGMRSHH